MGEHFGNDGPRRGPRSGGTIGERFTERRRDLEGVYAVLEHPRRRHALEVVEEDGALPIEGLARRVTAREQGVPIDAVTEGRRRSVAIALHHVHVPKLVDAGVIAVDREEGRVEPGPNLDQVVSAVEALAGELDGGRPSNRNGRSN